MLSNSETIRLIRTLLPNRAVRWFVLVSFFALPGAISAVHWWYLFFGNQPYESWWVLFRAKIMVWLLWGLMTPLILSVSGKFRLEQSKVASNLSILFLFSVIIAGAYILLYSLAVYLNFPSEFTAAPPGYWRLTHWVYWNHFTYFYFGFWVVVAIEQMIGYAVHSYKRETAAKELERQLTESRLSQLRAQIHPHFLFNTLNAISAMILESEKDRAFDAVSRLSHLLRLGLERGEKQYSPLAEELDFSREYLELMAVRYPDNLTFEINPDQKSVEALVPSLILQPLVENAIKHGMKSGDESIVINISAEVNCDKLILSIANRSRRKAEIDTEADGANQDSPGMGLKMTRERLQHLFEAEYNLAVEHPDNSSTNVILTMPLKFDKGNSD